MDVNGLNLYMYCGNNPVMRRDASGKSWNSFWKGVGNWFNDTWQWINENIFQPIGNFFSNTIPNFFVNTIWNNLIVEKVWKGFFVNVMWKQFLVPTGNWFYEKYHYVLFWTGAVALIAGIVLTIIASGGVAIPLWIQLVPQIIGLGLTIWQGIELYAS